MLPTRRQPARTRVGRAAALLAGLALLGACTTQPGVAARAGDHVVTDDEVSTATVEYNDASARLAVAEGRPRESAEQASSYQVARYLINQKVTAPAFAAAGATVTDAELDAWLQEVGFTGPDGGWSAPTRNLLRAVMQDAKVETLDPSARAVLEQGIGEVSEGLEYEVAPRYAADPQGQPLLPTWIATQVRAPEQEETPAG